MGKIEKASNLRVNWIMIWEYLHSIFAFCFLNGFDPRDGDEEVVICDLPKAKLKFSGKLVTAHLEPAKFLFFVKNNLRIAYRGLSVAHAKLAQRVVQNFPAISLKIEKAILEVEPRAVDPLTMADFNNPRIVIKGNEPPNNWNFESERGEFAYYLIITFREDEIVDVYYGD